MSRRLAACRQPGQGIVGNMEGFVECYWEWSATRTVTCDRCATRRYAFWRALRPRGNPLRRYRIRGDCTLVCTRGPRTLCWEMSTRDARTWSGRLSTRAKPITAVRKRDLGDRRIAFLHGHDSGRLRQEISSGRWDLVCCGHTHQRDLRAIRKGPSCLTPARLYRARPHSLAIVDLATLEVTSVTI